MIVGSKETRAENSIFLKKKISDLQEKESGADGKWMCGGFVRRITYLRNLSRKKKSEYRTNRG
jgi:hypothetical protein